jgi:hypothetical protein
LQNPPGDFQNGSTGIPAQANAITCVGATATGAAYWTAYEQLKLINEPGALNIILLMTDGQPTAIPFDFSAPIDTWGYNAIRWNLAAPAPQKYTTSSGSTFNVNSSRSPCSNTAGKVGVAFAYSSGSNIGGIYSPSTGARITGSAATNCRFNTTESNLLQDLAFLPNTDVFGTSVNSSTYKATTKWSSGHPDAGRIVSNQASVLENAAMNEVANAAIRIRNNETATGELNTITYSIGFGTGIGEDEFDMLRRAANVSHPTNNMYDASKPEGFFVYAPTTSALNEAFVRIASEILRLAK